jgi:hypothetical protein
LKILKLIAALGVLLLVPLSVAAQGQLGNIAALEFQTPKNGMVQQYEDGQDSCVTPFFVVFYSLV